MANDYGLEKLFDDKPVEYENITSAVVDAAPESVVTPGTPPDDQKAVTDEETSSEYSLDWLFHNEPDEHGDATTAVDVSNANTATEVDTATDLPAKDDAPAGDEASAMSPPTQKVLSDDTLNIRTPEDGPTDDDLIAVAQTADVSMDEATEHVPVESTLVEKTPVEEASAKDISIADKATDKAPIKRAPINLHIEYAFTENASVQNSPIQSAAPKDEVLEDAPPEETPAEDASAQDDDEEYDPERAPIEYAPRSTKQTPLQDTIIDDAPEEYAIIEKAPMADVTMDDPPKEDTTMSDALNTEELDTAEILKTLTILAHAISTPLNGFVKAETVKSPTVSPLSSPRSSPPPRKGLQKLVTASKSAAALHQARKRKSLKARHTAVPPAKKQKMSPATTATAPVPRLKRRQKQGVSAMRTTTQRAVTRAMTRSATTKPAAPAPAPSPVVKPPTPSPFPTSPILGKRKPYTGDAGQSTAPSANKRRRLSPPPAPAPAPKPATRPATATATATATRRKTAIPTVTARHTRSMGAKSLLYSADILALERGLRRGV
jgi:hypothetical protein